jgi:hypothetical protein
MLGPQRPSSGSVPRFEAAPVGRLDSRLERLLE